MKEQGTLIGLCFVTYDSDGRREYQGTVLDKLDNGFYLVQLYEWLLGSESTMRILSLNRLASANFYASLEDLKEGMEYHHD